MKTENMKKWGKTTESDWTWNGAIFIACGFWVGKRLPGDIQRCTRPKDISLAVLTLVTQSCCSHFRSSGQVQSIQSLMEWICNYRFPRFSLQDSSLGEKVIVGDFRCIVTKQFPRKSIWSAFWFFNSWELLPGKKEFGIWHLIMPLL